MLLNSFDPIRDVYHGTTLSRIDCMPDKVGQPLTEFEVDLSQCRPRTDFGTGFYATTSLVQARNWANMIASRSSISKRSSDRAAVLRFALNVDDAARLDTLWFVRGEQDFVTFVAGCRKADLDYHKRKLGAVYDIVAGPVSLYPQTSIIQDADQVSFHTQLAVNMLEVPVLLDIGRELDGLFATAYTQ